MAKKSTTPEELAKGSIVSPITALEAAPSQNKKVRHFAPGMKPGRRPLAEGGKKNGEGETSGQNVKHAPVVILPDGVHCGEWISDGQNWTRTIAPVITAESVIALYNEAKTLPMLPAKDSAQLQAWAALMRLTFKAEDASRLTSLMAYLATK
jgi:hypothetical protein